MSEAGGIDLLLLLFLVTAQAIRETNGNRTVIEAVVHIQMLPFEANSRTGRTAVQIPADPWFSWCVTSCDRS